MSKDRSLEGSGFRRAGRPRSKADIEAERARIDALHEELCQALAERYPQEETWADRKFGEREMVEMLRQMGYADDPTACELFPRAVEHIRHSMGQVAEFRSPVAMEHYRPGIAEPLCYSINRFTERKIREGIGKSEGCDFTTEEGTRIVLLKSDVGLLSFHDEDKPVDEFKSANPDKPKMPWEAS